MFVVIGIVIVFAMVFGGYTLAGGKFGIILYALPFEMMMIGGAAIGAFLVAQGGAGAKATAKALKSVFAGPRWKRADYRDLLVLLHELLRTGRQNPMALEEHIEAPGQSAIFARHPRILADGEAVALICDTLRAASLNFDDPHQVEELLTARLDAHLHHALHPSHALQTMADGLPALGIVAAVLGVIKTMSSIDQPPTVLGGMIGGALVGTFLGVFLAYTLVGPFAQKVRDVVEADQHFYSVIRDVLVAGFHKHPPNICVEVGRQHIPAALRPPFAELEDALRGAAGGEALAA